MAVLLFTGVRVGEVVAADVADLGTDQRRRVLWVTRGGERRGLPLPAAAAVRRSFATFYLDAGGSLRDLQNALGHADPRTTRRYDRDRAPDDVVAAYLAGPASGSRRDPGRLRRAQ